MNRGQIELQTYIKIGFENDKEATERSELVERMVL